MNKTEAVHINALLSWLLDKPRSGGGHLTAADIHISAVELARRVSTALGAAVAPDEVDRAFTEGMRVVQGPAYVVRLGSQEVRLALPKEDACDDLSCTEHPECQARQLTDDELALAAERILRKDMPIDDQVAYTFESIVDLAWRERHQGS